MPPKPRIKTQNLPGFAVNLASVPAYRPLPATPPPCHHRMFPSLMWRCSLRGTDQPAPGIQHIRRLKSRSRDVKSRLRL